MKCGLLGRKLGHSYSPAIHQQLGDYEYRLYEKEPEELEVFLRCGDWDGVNVTMPYKQAVIPYLDQVSPAAAQLGAVNTIVRREGKLIGYNTDYFGFQSMLERSGLSPSGKKCLVLGSGGASKVAVQVLSEQGANVVVISRSGDHNYHNIGHHKDAALIVNTTPVGMYPQVGVSPVELGQFPQLEGVLDVIYNPATTRLLLDARSRGLPTINGLWMLVAQAVEASRLMTGTNISDHVIQDIYHHMRQQMENIILIGMPGCGKSTVGHLIAEKLGKPFVDTDAEIEKLAQKNIPRIFAEDGEAVFRELETRVLAEHSKRSGLVIATGGGCVTISENKPLLHQNGVCFWLQRDAEKLATAGRPLSVDLKRMYDQRMPLYASFGDAQIDNNLTPEDAAAAIMAYWEEKI